MPRQGDFLIVSRHLSQIFFSCTRRRLIVPPHRMHPGSYLRKIILVPSMYISRGSCSTIWNVLRNSMGRTMRPSLSSLRTTPVDFIISSLTSSQTFLASCVLFFLPAVIGLSWGLVVCSKGSADWRRTFPALHPCIRVGRSYRAAVFCLLWHRISSPAPQVGCHSPRQ